MAEARYSTLLEKMKKAYIGTGSGMAKLKAGWKWENGQYVKVWSGATVVSYYDGETLMGTEEVDEGEDVLHPSFSTSKKGYTLYGWSADGENRDTELVAQGDTMTLYALYVPNSIVVCVSAESGSSATVSTWNTKYMSGAAFVIQESPGPSLTNTANFGITLHEYQNSTITLWTHDYTIDEQGYGHDYTGSMGIDGSDTSQYHNGNVLYNWSGNHTMRVHAFPNWGIGERFERVSGGLANVTLSNPIAWE